MKVCVSVHGRFHAFELAAGLHRRGVLSRLLTTYPGFAVARLSGNWLPVTSAWWLEARRRLLPGKAVQVALPIRTCRQAPTCWSAGVRPRWKPSRRPSGMA